MRKVFILIAVVAAYATMTFGDVLDLSDTNVWRTRTTGTVASLFVAKNGDYVIANLYAYNDANNTQVWYSRKSGVYGVDFDKDSHLWIATDDGLMFKSSPSSADSVVYRVKDGLPSDVVRTVYCDKVNNRIIISTDNGVGISSLDSDGKPTTWSNILSASIHQFVGQGVVIWAINNTKVYCFDGTKWTDDNGRFGTPISGDVDKDGNFYISFSRGAGADADQGLAKFENGEWKELIVSRSPSSYFGDICIDKDNVLWFAAQDEFGCINLSTMVIERKPAGAYPFNPEGESIEISETDKGKVIFLGYKGWVENISTTSSAVRPLSVRPMSRGVITNDFVAYDVRGRRIPNSFSSYSSARSSFGVRINVVQTPNGPIAKRIITR